MKRFLHALAALWPKRKEAGKPPAPPTSTGLRQHLAAVLRIEGYLSECTDIHSRKRHAVKSDTLPARREEEWSGSMYHRTECDHVGHPSSKTGSQTVGITDRSSVTSGTRPARREGNRSGSPNPRTECDHVGHPFRKAGSQPVGINDSTVRRINEYTTNLLDESPNQQIVESPNQQFVESPNQLNNHPRIPQPMPLLTILMLVFFMCLMAAPSRVFGSAAFLDSIPESAIRPLKIGDTIPEELWHLPLQVVNHPEGKETITLNDYRDKKLIILDFWATWCAPCISSLYKLDTLQAHFNDDIAVIPTSYEDANKVAPFFVAKGWNLPTAVSERKLKEYFPHRSLPHQGWLTDGKLLAVTGHQYASNQMIVDILAGKPMRVQMKDEEVSFHKGSPLLFNGNGGEVSNMLSQAMFTKRVRLRIGGRSVGDDYFMLYNATVRDMIFEAYNDTIPYYGRKNRIILEIPRLLQQRIYYQNTLPESTSQFYQDSALYAWQDENTYCYDLRLPIPTPRAHMRALFKQDLQRFLRLRLGLKMTVEKRDVLCYVLKDDARNSSPRSLGESYEVFDPQTGSARFGNKPISHVFQVLAGINNESKYPFVNKASDGLIDIDFNGDTKDLSFVATALQAKGLTLSIENCKLDMVVVSEVEL